MPWNQSTDINASSRLQNSATHLKLSNTPALAIPRMPTYRAGEGYPSKPVCDRSTMHVDFASSKPTFSNGWESRTQSAPGLPLLGQPRSVASVGRSKRRPDASKYESPIQRTQRFLEERRISKRQALARERAGSAGPRSGFHRCRITPLDRYSLSEADAVDEKLLREEHESSRHA